MSTRAAPHNQRGAVAVAFILVVVALLGFVALGVDAGRLYVSKSELQTAADACALAASSALTGANNNQLAIAESFGIAAGTRNRVGMQSVAPTLAVDSTVTFSNVLNGNFLPKSSIASGAVSSMRFVRCTLNEPAIPSILMQALGAMGQVIAAPTIGAQATAALVPSVSACAIPLALCAKTLTGAPDYGYVQGEWLAGRFQPGSGSGGKYKWVSFPAYARKNDIANLLATAGQCDLDASVLVTPQSGVVSSLEDAWNWRFGVAKSSGPPAGAYPPDLTGFAYTGTNWPSQANAYSDFITRRAANTPWNNQPSLGGNWIASSIAVHAGGGDRRMAVMPMVDCTNWNSGGSTAQPILAWSCALMLNPVANANTTMAVEYRGSASNPASGCATSGAPGGPNSRGPNVPGLVQ